MKVINNRTRLSSFESMYQLDDEKTMNKKLTIGYVTEQLVNIKNWKENRSQAYTQAGNQIEMAQSNSIQKQER